MEPTPPPASRASDTSAPPYVPPTPVPLLQWQDVPTSALQPYAPDPQLPMLQYAMMTVMAWAQAQGYAGAIPTWEIGDGTWGVILLLTHPDLTLTSIPLGDLEPFSTTNGAGWAQAVMRWAAPHGYQIAIPTFASDDTSVSALVFGPGYPAISFYDADNGLLFQSLAQARKLCNLADPPVWANAVMRVARSRGYGAGWPTWEATTTRGIMGLPAFDNGPLPPAMDATVDRVLKVLNKTLSALNTLTGDALADFAGIYGTFAAAPVSAPTLALFTDCVFGAIEAGLNLIPEVGGALGSLVGMAVNVAQDAASGAAGSGPTTLETYQAMLTAASNATANAIATLHDTLMDSQQNGTQQQVWEQVYQPPLGGPPVQLGMLANASDDVADGDEYWTQMGEQMTRQLNLNLQVAITGQLYTIQRLPYTGAGNPSQWWRGSIAEVTAPTGKCAAYIASGDEGQHLSFWFTDFAQEPGHALGEYVTATEFWLQANGSTLAEPAYPPRQLSLALFASDGFQNVQTPAGTYTGAFDKPTVYNAWLIPAVEQTPAYNQQWSYLAGGNIVTATIVEIDNQIFVPAGWTDAYGNLYLDTTSPIVQEADQEFNFQRPVIMNGLSPVNP